MCLISLEDQARFDSTLKMGSLRQKATYGVIFTYLHVVSFGVVSERRAAIVQRSVMQA